MFVPPRPDGMKPLMMTPAQIFLNRMRLCSADPGSPSLELIWGIDSLKASTNATCWLMDNASAHERKAFELCVPYEHIEHVVVMCARGEFRRGTVPRPRIAGPAVSSAALARGLRRWPRARVARHRRDVSIANFNLILRCNYFPVGWSSLFAHIDYELAAHDAQLRLCAELC